MKHFFLFRLSAFAALLTTLMAQSGRAQERPMKVAHDADGTAYIANEIIVRFNPAVVKPRVVNDLNIQRGTLSSFVQPNAIEQMHGVVDLDFSQVATFKIFYHMTTADTLSVSRLGDTVSVAKLWSAFVLQLPPGYQEKDVCASLSTLFPTIIYAHRNLAFELNTTNPPPVPLPNDTNFGLQSSLVPTTRYPNANINMRQAWQYAQGDNSIKVGVFDTGIDATHPDLNNGSTFGPVVTGGYDYVRNQPRFNIADNFGHGTACAGIIGARRNNGVGVSGIAGGNFSASQVQYGVQLFDMKILDDNGYLIPMSAAAAAFSEGSSQATASSGYGYRLNVMSNSWGKASSSISASDVRLLRESMFTVFQNKVVLVASKGNLGVTSLIMPADMSDDWVLSVGASGTNGDYKDASNGDPTPPFPFGDSYPSNYSNGVDLIAPGSTANVYTTRSRVGTWGGVDPSTAEYTAFNGTSAAAPHVAGVAALMLQYKAQNAQGALENLAPEDIEEIMQRTATDKYTINANAPYDDHTGWGLLNAGKALGSVRGAYRLVHDKGYAFGYNYGTTTRPIVLSDPYSGPGINLQAGVVYNAAVDQATVYFNPQQSLGFGDQLIGAWVRNSSSALWGPVGSNNMVNPYPGMSIVHGWNAASLQVTCYKNRVNNNGYNAPSEYS